MPVFAQSNKDMKGIGKVDQLSLYTTPTKTSHFEEAKPTHLEERISVLRKSAETFITQYQKDDKSPGEYIIILYCLMTWAIMVFHPRLFSLFSLSMTVIVLGNFFYRTGLLLPSFGQHLYKMGVYKDLKPKIEKTVQIGKDGYTFLKNPPPGFYPRTGIIALAGVAGLLLAGRGSRVRKVFYSCGFVTACASLYYPQQTVEIAKATGSSLYELSMQTYLTIESLWKKYRDQKPEASPIPGNSQVTKVQMSDAKSSS